MFFLVTSLSISQTFSLRVVSETDIFVSGDDADLFADLLILDATEDDGVVAAAGIDTSD